MTMCSDDEPLTRALAQQRDAAQLGFDWPDVRGVWAKVDEELRELRDASDGSARHEELGDVLFAVVNLARHLNVDPASALAATNAKFNRRFAAVQQAMADAGHAPGDATLAQMDAAWDAAKRAERGEAGDGRAQGIDRGPMADRDPGERDA